MELSDGTEVTYPNLDIWTYPHLIGMSKFNHPSSDGMLTYPDLDNASYSGAGHGTNVLHYIPVPSKQALGGLMVSQMKHSSANRPILINQSSSNLT